MDIIAIIAIGFASSVFGSFTSGGFSVLGFALLSAYGLSPLLVLATFKVGAFGSQVGGLYNYAKADKILWDKVLIFILLGIPAAYLGTKLVISIDEVLLGRIVGFILLAFIPLTMLSPKLGVVSVATSQVKQLLGHIFYFLISIYAYSFVIGAGIFASVTQSYFYGMTLLEAKGTGKIPNIIKGIVSVLVLSGTGVVNWQLGIAFFIGAFIGALVGTYYSIKAGDVWLRRILLVTVAVVAIKLLLGL
jgi:uncharacterized protein